MLQAARLIERAAEPERPRFQLRPLVTVSLRRHAQHQRARLLQAFLNLRRNAVAGLQYSFIEPHAQPVRPQAFGEGAHAGFVLAAVAQEDVVVELVSHNVLLRRS